MKKFILFITVATTIYGQSMFRIVGGPNISNFINDSDSDFLTGYSIGLMYEQSFSKNWSVETGILYTKVGGFLKNKIERVTYPYDKDTLYFKMHINAMAGFFIFPIHIKYKLLKWDYEQTLSVHTGFSYQFAIADYVYKDFSPDFNDNETKREYEYESGGMGESIFDGAENVTFDLGINYSYHHLFLALNTYFQLKEFGQYDNLSTIKKKLYTMELLIGYTF